MEMAMENITRAQQEVEMSSQFNIRFTVMMNVAQPVGTLAIITNIPYGQSSAKLPVTQLLGHSVTWSPSHLVTQSLGHYFQHCHRLTNRQH